MNNDWEDDGGGSSTPGVVHEYDGIQELDNHLPRWWLYTLFGAIVFGAGYWFYFHTYDAGGLPSQQHAREVALAKSKEAEAMKEAGEVTPQLLEKLSFDDKTVEDGRKLFEQNCVTCHAEGGKGNIGPNLTDEYFLHGGKPLDLYKTVSDGYLEKQMPAWRPKLGEARTRTVVAYLLSVEKTNVPNGKAPQGDRE